MGLLTEGRPLSWEETHAHADHVRKHGLIQFVNLYHELKGKPFTKYLLITETGKKIFQTDKEMSSSGVTKLSTTSSSLTTLTRRPS